MKRVLLFLCLAVMGLASCSKSDSVKVYPDGNGEAPVPIKRSSGRTLGTAVSKSIGPAGGTLQSKDGRLQLDVPAGAVANSVAFSIQEVENTLPGSPGKAFRLLPEGLAFARPVTLTYALSEVELENALPGAVYLAYQDQDGFHHMAMNSVVDAEGKNVSVQTTHFSDWTIAELLKLVVDKSEVSPGATANLKLQWYLGSLLAPLTGDQPMGDLVDYNGYVSKVSWALASGSGSIRPDGIRCEYKAPSKVPANNPALVSVSVPISLHDSKRKGLAILTEPILTVPDEYFIITLDGNTTINKAPSDGETWIRMEADNFYVSSNLQDGHSIYVLIPGGLPGTTSYTYGDGDGKAYIDLSSDASEDVYITEKRNCEACDIVYSGGSVKFKKIGQVGDYVEGEFSAELWKMGYYSPPKKNITGKFRVKRT